MFYYICVASYSYLILRNCLLMFTYMCYSPSYFNHWLTTCMSHQFIASYLSWNLKKHFETFYTGMHAGTIHIKYR